MRRLPRRRCRLLRWVQHGVPPCHRMPPRGVSEAVGGRASSIQAAEPTQRTPLLGTELTIRLPIPRTAQPISWSLGRQESPGTQMGPRDAIRTPCRRHGHVRHPPFGGVLRRPKAECIRCPLHGDLDTNERVFLRGAMLTLTAICSLGMLSVASAEARSAYDRTRVLFRRRAFAAARMANEAHRTAQAAANERLLRDWKRTGACAICR